jgi:hypothetical protein
VPIRFERILALKEAGADLALLGFLHFQEEVKYFGDEVIPRVEEQGRAGAKVDHHRAAVRNGPMIGSPARRVD